MKTVLAGGGRSWELQLKMRGYNGLLFKFSTNTIIDKTESLKCPLGGSRKSWKFDIHCSILLDFYLFYKLRQLPGPASSVSFVNCRNTSLIQLNA